MDRVLRYGAVRVACFAAALMLMVSSGASGAVSGMEVSPAQPVLGDAVEVAMRMNNGPACSTWSMVLQFDSAKLRFTGQTAGDASTFIADSRSIAEINSSGEVRVGGYGLSDQSRTGVLARLWFRAAATGVTAVATANRLEMREFGNSTYSLAGLETRPVTPEPVTITIMSSTDNDHDGMPDAWEIRYFGSTNATANTDFESDGMGNLAEYVAGTDPTNSSSLFTANALRSQGGGFVLSFLSAAGRAYSVQYKDDLLVTNWSVLTNDIPGSGGEVQVTDTNLTARRFYRIGVKTP